MVLVTGGLAPVGRRCRCPASTGATVLDATVLDALRRAVTAGRAA